MYINKEWKFYKNTLVELTNEEILELLNFVSIPPKKELEIEEFNFKNNLDNWLEKWNIEKNIK